MAERFHRRSIRLRGYDYTRAGAYYVTVCTQDRLPLFGDVVNDVMVPNGMGQIVQRCWDAIPEHMPMVVCDAFVVMPNHVHGVVVITDHLVPVVAEHGSMAGATGGGRGGKFPAPTTAARHPGWATAGTIPGHADHGQKFVGPHHANVQGRRFPAGRARWDDATWNAHLATRVLRIHHP